MAPDRSWIGHFLFIAFRLSSLPLSSQKRMDEERDTEDTNGLDLIWTQDVIMPLDLRQNRYFSVRRFLNVLICTHLSFVSIIGLKWSSLRMFHISAHPKRTNLFIFFPQTFIFVRSLMHCCFTTIHLYSLSSCEQIFEFSLRNTFCDNRQSTLSSIQSTCQRVRHGY